MLNAMATLLKRSDVPLYRLYVGTDWQSFAEQLAHEQCFDVHPMLHAPRVVHDAEVNAAFAIQSLGANMKKNGWFQATPNQAVGILAAVLPSTEEDDAPGNATPAPKRRRTALATEEVPAPVPAESTALVENITRCDHCGDALTVCTSDASPDSPQSRAEIVEEENKSDEVDPLWAYVTPCATREASKCTEIRATLEERCGKDVARKLLANTTSTVAQDLSGKKNRVLKLDGSLIKLK